MTWEVQQSEKLISHIFILGWSPSFYLGLIEVRQNVSYIFSYRVDLHLFMWDLLRSGLLSCRELDLRGQEKWTKPGYWLLTAIMQSESSFLVSWSVHFHLIWIWISFLKHFVFDLVLYLSLNILYLICVSTCLMSVSCVSAFWSNPPWCHLNCSSGSRTHYFPLSDFLQVHFLGKTAP